jgi:hypothetical protein
MAEPYAGTSGGSERRAGAIHDATIRPARPIQRLWSLLGIAWTAAAGVVIGGAAEGIRQRVVTQHTGAIT